MRDPNRWDDLLDSLAILGEMLAFVAFVALTVWLARL